MPKVKGEVGVDLNTSEIVCSNGKRYATPLKLPGAGATQAPLPTRLPPKDCGGQSVDGIEPECEIIQGRKVACFNNLRKAYWKVGRVTEHAANVRKDWQHNSPSPSFARTKRLRWNPCMSVA
ncbi:MAG: hypothetical protein WJ306_02980 [Ferrovum myxofaciens]